MEVIYYQLKGEQNKAVLPKGQPVQKPGHPPPAQTPLIQKLEFKKTQTKLTMQIWN